MGNLSTQIYAELKGTSPSAFHVLLVFLSLVIAFGILSSNHPNLWGAFLPTLLMGLSYGVISLSLDGLFREDWNDGTIEWWVSEGKSLEVYAVIKILSHWIRLGIPLAGIAGVITGFKSFSLVFGVAATTLIVILLGAIASALSLTLKASSSVLLPLLTLPLGIPMMIVSMATVADPTAGVSSYLMLQGGLFFMSAALSLLACPFALRLALR